MIERDLLKLNRRFYFFNEDENKKLIDILSNRFGEYIKIFDIEVTQNLFRFNTLWRPNVHSGNTCSKFDVPVDVGVKNNTFNQIYDFLVAKEISESRILQLRKIGI
jgi:hypothetical protein